MMSEEMHEIHEHAETGHHEPAMAPVSITMAVLAVLVAISSLLVHRSTTRAILFQSQASDLWAYYQAKDIRRHSYELFSNLLPLLDPRGAAKTRDLTAQYNLQAQRYKDQQSQISEQARALETRVEHQERRAGRFELSEVLLEVALIICSLTLLTHRRSYWLAGTVLAAIGLGAMLTGVVMHFH
ncbi:MAG TPA: DUF4337 domain-containing protein [Terriglobia bacterium]|nr:DUF4337 domain-containing protein [Terriglobia bacterium]